MNIKNKENGSDLFKEYKCQNIYTSLRKFNELVVCVLEVYGCNSCFPENIPAHKL